MQVIETQNAAQRTKKTESKPFKRDANVILIKCKILIRKTTLFLI